MAKYSDPMDPNRAVRQFRGRPGNYILHFKDGSTYVGRQGEQGVRLGTHMRKHGNKVSAVQFMHDHSNNPCVRATRERQTLDRLKKGRKPVKNKIKPSEPTACRRLTKKR